MNDTDNPDETGFAEGQDGASELLDADIAALLSDPSTWAEPSPELGARVVAAVRSESTLGGPSPASAATSDARRRLGWLRPALVGAAAAVAFVFGGIVVLSALSGTEPATDAFSEELVSTGLLPDVGGEIEVTSFESGLRIDLGASGLPRRDDGKFYEGWVRTVDDDLIPVGTFHDGADVVLWAGVELDRIVLFTITLEEAAGPVDAGQGTSGDVVLRTEISP